MRSGAITEKSANQKGLADQPALSTLSPGIKVPERKLFVAYRAVLAKTVILPQVADVGVGPVNVEHDNKIRSAVIIEIRGCLIPKDLKIRSSRDTWHACGGFKN